MYLGLAQQAQEKFDSSLASFERAAKLENGVLAQPALINAGASALQLGDLDGAQARLERSLEAGDDAELAQSANEILDQIHATRHANKPWRITLGTGIQHDDNVSTDEINVNTGLDDFALLLGAGASYSFDVIRDVELEVSYDFSQTLYFHRSDFSLQSHSAGLYAGTELAGTDVSAIYSYTRTILGGDDFLVLHTARIRHGWRLKRVQATG